MWHVTRYTLHVTRDTWHMTHDTWHVTRLGGWTFSQNFSSLSLTVCDLWYYEDLEEKDEWINKWINYEAVWGSLAWSTPGYYWPFWWVTTLILSRLLLYIIYVTTQFVQLDPELKISYKTHNDHYY